MPASGSIQAGAAVKLEPGVGGSEVAKLRAEAMAMMGELPGAAKSGDLEGFLEHLLPKLMAPHGLGQAAIAASAPATRPQGQGGVRGLGGHKDWVGAVSDIVQKAFQECIELGGGDGPPGAPTEWDMGLAAVDEDLPLRLSRCKKCSRVVTQRHFAKHWAACENFDHTPYAEREKATELKAKTITPAKKKDKTAVGGWDGGYVDVEVEVTTCDGCGLSPVVGKRFQCRTCVEFDLCEACYTAGVPASKHDPTHQYTEVDIPVVMPRVALPMGDSKPGVNSKKQAQAADGPIDFDK